jgi:hypothetical protein
MTKEVKQKLCSRCGRPGSFYTDKDGACIDCNADALFVRRARRLGEAELQARIKDYTRRVELTREALQSLKERSSGHEEA